MSRILLCFVIAVVWKSFLQTDFTSLIFFSNGWQGRSKGSKGIGNLNNYIQVGVAEFWGGGSSAKGRFTWQLMDFQPVPNRKVHHQYVRSRWLDDVL